MQVGICCSGVGPTVDPAFITNSAKHAERLGFSTLWLSDHVVLFDDYSQSDYPYKGMFGSDVPLPDPTMPIIDPVVAMTWAAAATRTIDVGSAIVILPQRNPVVLAKEVATLDYLSGGRVSLGVGVGWCKEEYDAVGAEWEPRGKRTDEHIQAMRALWQDTASTFHGDGVSFDRAYSFPKPVRERRVPVLIGGESDVALKRVARLGDGWIAFKLPVEEAPAKVERLRALVKEQGRDPNQLRFVCGIFRHTSVDDLKRYRDAGITEFNLVDIGEMPMDEPGLTSAMEDLARRIVEPASQL